MIIRHFHFLQNRLTPDKETISIQISVTHIKPVSYTHLNSINSPDDLRRLEVDQLPAVCDELRQDIIKELSCNPGHFAASLGTVELTVALHYVYNTPYDRIVDVYKRQV